MEDRIQPKAVHIIDDQELHMMGNDVAVVWQLTHTTRQITKVEDGVTWTANKKTTIRAIHPTISFVWVRLDPNNKEVYLDDDGTSRGGGMTADQAESLAGQLMQAVYYVRQQEGK